MFWVSTVFHDDTGECRPENEFVDKRVCVCVCVINAFDYLNEGIEEKKKNMLRSTQR